MDTSRDPIARSSESLPRARESRMNRDRTRSHPFAHHFNITRKWTAHRCDRNAIEAMGSIAPLRNRLSHAMTTITCA
jgi:hypothetical protein